MTGFTLAGGGHEEANPGKCAMERLSQMLGTAYGDNPATAYDQLAYAVQSANDMTADVVGVEKEVAYTVTRLDGSTRECVVTINEIPEEYSERLIKMAWLTVDTDAAFKKVDYARRDDIHRWLTIAKAVAGKFFNEANDALERHLGGWKSDHRHEAEALLEKGLAATEALLTKFRVEVGLKADPQTVRPLALPALGDIGEPLRHIELEPLEEPLSVPAEPVTVPQKEPVPA